ncbi:dynein light chain Tctex-type protein 2B-like [Mya arenaria]|uniref:dynein light chain Tctex-type protein 2B-like n=1 Tax=Mya arenaria TaxID=6604 RepID=UPI0022DE9AA2|nr:dynein light chain Tctex-type protein 2B-like [Mya arenaria]
MESKLSKEVLRAHNASESGSHDAASRLDVLSHKTPMRERAGTMMSESSTGTGHGRLKLQRLRHKIKLFGGSFSKSGSESQVTKHYENTYRIEPREGKHFATKKAEDIIHTVLESYLKGKSYDSKKCAILSKSLAELIKERIKASGCERYKIISHVMILENGGQSMRHVSRCLWNKDTDNYATATFETQDFIAVGSVFASYYD